MLVSAESIFAIAIAPKNPRTVPTADQRRAFAQHQPQHLRLACAQRHANGDLLAPLRNRVGRHSGESDCGQHQAEHSNSAVGCAAKRMEDRLRSR